MVRVESNADQARKHVSDLIAAAQAAETASVGWRRERLREALSGSLVVVAAGGTHAAASYWARLHSIADGLAMPMTPYDFVERALPPGTKVLLLSMSGRHHDMLSAARHARDNAAGVQAVVGDRSAPLVSILRERDDADALVIPRPPHSGVVEQWGVVSLWILALQTYGYPGPWTPRFEVEPVAPPAELPDHLYCLGGGFGRAAAHDFARVVQESDLCRASAHDVRDFAHGNFFPANRPGTAIALFSQGDQRDYAAQVAEILAPHMPVIQVREPDSTVTGGLRLMARARLTHATWVDHFGRRPVRDDIPGWAVKLYHLPFE